MMTRYERVSSDCLPSSNGKKSHITENGRLISHAITTTTTITSFKSSSSRSQDHNHNASNCSPSHSDHASPSRGGGGGSISTAGAGGGVNGDVFLQWGQKKRARVSRSEIRALADESSSSVQAKQPINKIPRRADSTSKLSTPPMPPPLPPPPHSNGGSKGGSFKKESSSFLSHRVLEKRSSAGNVSPSRNSGSGGGSSRVVSRSTSGKRSPPTSEKVDKKLPNNSKPSKHDKPNGSSMQHTEHIDLMNSTSKSEHEVVVNNNHATMTMTTTSIMASVGEKLNVEWPRIYLALSRKEKEDDFFAMKGTKLPQRPKKRPKNIDKALQYCFPGMWLSDLTKSRYEVREKKCVKKQPKQRRGLKGMESVESDTE